MKDQNKLYKWKQQFEINSKIVDVQNKGDNEHIYECEIGRGKAAKIIGKTFATKIKAGTGDIITVSVDSIQFDKDAGKYTWYTPKVIAVRKDKKLPDPISTVKKIVVERKSAARSKNIITLTEVIPKLKRADFDHE
ncbi:MAG: hypothetical protein GWN00_21930, partial [Aliifodinibius sp.]|nr:hypothetical protein [Phycisphaerae bacterium]NIT58780.1 hypothetical protein [Fodinibius sp.]NIV13616.1 hypothetical protein [Fodinibius sp.]NIY27363.1 hypothetical protein [Fodinibius sp.]